MLGAFSRTELLFGKEPMEALARSRVAVFGIGGVGGYVCEALCRSGVGAFDLVDDDRVCLTNLNRQIHATRSTVGRLKAEVMRERILDINPKADVRVHTCFFLPENADTFPFADYDYVVDAVDTVSAKIALAMTCAQTRTPIISCMGAGNKLDPTAFRVSDIYETRVDPLARVMRRELRRRGVKGLKVVWSEEQPIRPIEDSSISWQRGAASMCCFCLGTIPLMLGVGLLSGRFNKRFAAPMRYASAALVLAMGVSTLANGLALAGVGAPTARPTDEDGAAIVQDGVQTIRSELDYGGYPVITVRAGIPVEWTIHAEEDHINSCNRELCIPRFGLSVTLEPGDNLIRFTPDEAGAIPYTCWMGMIRSTIYVI